MDAIERLNQVKSEDSKIKSFLSFTSAQSISKQRDGKLKGMSLAVKSNINIEGFIVSAASKTLEDYISPYDATVVEKIKKEGGTILGILNMDEFACGSSGETSYFGPTQNPNAPGHIPGGSSSGSAAAVAAGFVDAALGSDTGGSIRNPASHCGVVGFKPTYGVVSRYGLCDLAMSLDQIGPLAKDVKTAATLLEVISGPDMRDGTSLNLEQSFYRFAENLNPDLKDVKIGYAKEFDDLIVDNEIKKSIHAALDTFASGGAEIINVELPNLEIALPTYYLNVYVEFFSATRKYDGRRYGKKIEDACGEEVLRRIFLGEYISQKEFSGRFYKKALMARSVIRKDLERALSGVDVLVGPTVPKLPHKIGEKIEDPMTMYAYDIFTVPVNLAGIPAGSVPAERADNIPTGLQVIGNALEDQKVLNVMAGFESIM